MRGLLKIIRDLLRNSKQKESRVTKPVSTVAFDLIKTALLTSDEAQKCVNVQRDPVAITQKLPCMNRQAC